MSDADIDKGSRGLEEVGRALEGIKVGIICLTPENQKEPWILYEAGALSKTLDARVCTYLLAGLRWQDVEPPLESFQATTAVRDDTLKLVHTVNKALDGTPVPDRDLEEVFDGMWSRLEKALAAIPEHAPVVKQRSVEDMMTEVLAQSREAAKAAGVVAALTQDLYLVGAAVEELADAVAELQPAVTALPTATFRPNYFSNLGRRRFFSQRWAGLPPYTATSANVAEQLARGEAALRAAKEAAIGDSAVANAVRAGSGEESVGVPIRPAKIDDEKK
jgi:hypothetical protein